MDIEFVCCEKMDKAFKMAKTSARGSFHLFFGKIASTLILGISTIVLAALIKDEELGLYSVALIPALTLLLFQDLGVSSAIIKKCAEYLGTNNEGKLRGLIEVGLTFNATTGIILTLVSLLSANYIAPTIFGKPEATLLIIVVSITILFTSLLTASQSIFIGFERMKLSSYTLVCQAIIQGILSPLLVFLGYGAMGAIIGYTLAIVFTGIFAILLLHFVILKKLPSTQSTSSNKSQILKMLLSYGLPLALSTILIGILTNFYSFMMASLVEVAMIGNYQIASYFGAFLAFFTYPISTALFPAFSKLNPQKESELIKTVFASSVKYTVLLLVPATMAMMVLSKSIIGVLYGDKWLYAAFFLTLFVINNLFSVFGNLSLNSLLRGLGETKMLMKQNILTLILGIPLAFLLIPTFGIPAVILGPILAGKPSLAWGLYYVWKKYKITVDFNSTARLFITSAIAAVLTYLLLNFIDTVEWIRLIVGVTFFFGIYILATPLIGGLNQKEIANVKFMFSDLGIFSKILNILFSMLEKIVNYRQSFNKKTDA